MEREEYGRDFQGVQPVFNQVTAEASVRVDVYAVSAAGRNRGALID
tara:strand:- start:879 stop:1016 length:138 start_codon:yes stop_codon:yes gene_type:complete